MKILMIGGGGREHALLWKLRQSPSVDALYCAPGNAGIAALADCIPMRPTDLAEAATFAERNRIDLTVVGPELPLTLGIADEFARRSLPVFGPSRAAAQLEGSKVFAKEFMARHGIPTAAARSFTSFEECRDHLGGAATSCPVVLKVDGLAAGKGVVIAPSPTEAEAFARSVLVDGAYGSAGGRLLVEECLEGREASFFALCDGERVLPLLACQDYKRIGDGDQGPNTGGMGSLCPSPTVDADLSARVLREIVVPTVRGLAEEGRPYRGLLYTGLMLTAAGPRVLEFNVRFGDPETQALMPRVAGDLAAAMHAAATGGLESVKLEWHPEVCVSVVLASRGYPGRYEVGKPIEGLSVADAEDGVIVFHAGTRMEGSQVVTAGGRVLAVSALGRDFGQARRRAYAAAAAVRFEGKTFRGDIAADAVEET